MKAPKYGEPGSVAWRSITPDLAQEFVLVCEVTWALTLPVPDRGW